MNKGRAEQKMHLQKFNLSTSQTSTMWARIIVRRLSFDWSRKLAINTSRSLVSIFSNSLGSFLQTKYFINNETSLWVLLYVFLMLFFLYATQTLLRSNQPTKTCYSFPSFPAFCVNKFGGVARKPPNLESHKRWTTLILAQKGIYAVVDWLCFHMWKQLHVRHSDWLYKLFSHVENKVYRFLQISFTK